MKTKPSSLISLAIFLSLTCLTTLAQTIQPLTVRVNNNTSNYSIYIDNIEFNPGSYLVNGFINEKGKKDLDPEHSGFITIQPKDEGLEGGIVLDVVDKNHNYSSVAVMFSEQELRAGIVKDSLRNKVFINIGGKTTKWYPGQIITINVADALH